MQTYVEDTHLLIKQSHLIKKLKHYFNKKGISAVFTLPFAFASNCDKLVHLASKRTTRLAELRVLILCSFVCMYEFVCVCAHAVEIIIRVAEK